ncbi:hypothetical protein [Georgenia wangjunii]|uniref:hypothetical protein n=1 Tax=Georgenia wangjunii TaxID=3117730 RepID=UPI002F269F69
MTAQTVRPLVRQRKARSTRFRLDIGEWLVLRGAVLDAVPDAPVPADFAPAAFGLTEFAPLTEAERRRSWQMLAQRGLARYVPSNDDLDAVVQPFAAGLMTLALADVRVDVRSWSGAVGVAQSTAWRDGHTVALSRRRRLASPARSGELQYEQESTVEISLASDGSLVEEILRALPLGDDTTGPDTVGGPVTTGWTMSHTVADAMRRGRQEVVPHLFGLDATALGALGTTSTALTGGVQILAYRSPTGRPEMRADQLAFEGAWVWTGADIIELLSATADKVTLQRTTMCTVRTRLLSALTRLLHADEFL